VSDNDEAHKLPAVRNFAIAPAAGFTGRREELDRLRQLLVSGAPAAPLAAVHGLGGVGKTQLALAYAARFMGDYDVAWWIRAEQPATLAYDFAALASGLRLTTRGEPDQRAAVESVRQWLARNGRWLLIFDSVREPHDLDDYLVPGPLGHTLVTSRHAAWRGVALPLSLRGLTRSEAVELLLTRSGAMDRSGVDQDVAADALAEALGDLPLALTQAAAFMEEHALTVPAYLELFRERQEELLRRGAAGGSEPTVATIWDIAFRELSARAPAAADLLALLAFLAADDIPRDGLREGAGACPPSLAAALRDPIAFGEQIAALRRYSLIEVQDDALRVHRLVQGVVRERLTDAERRAWAEVAASAVDQIFPQDLEDKGVWPKCRRWLPHVRKVIERAGAARVAERQVERLLHRAATYARRDGMWSEARDLYQRAIAVGTPLYGADHPEVANLYRGVALTMVLGQIGVPSDARKLAEQALAIHTARYGEDDESAARDHAALVRICRALGDAEGVSAHLAREIAIYETIYGPDSPRLIGLLNDRGFVLREQRKTDEARRLFERVLAIGVARYGADDPDVATIHGNLAAVLEELGEFHEARRHMERAIAIGEKCYGPDHYAVAIRRNNLGILLHSMGDLVGARRELSRAVEVARKVFPPGHRRLVKLEGNLAKVGQ
jgi:tetratricopeptide (TPR) repeat protein